MSYILDALKKADRERSLGDVPDLETAHWGERRGKRSWRWAWALLALLVVNGILLAVLLGRDDDAGTPSRPAPAKVDKLPVSPVPKTKTAAIQPSRKITRPREPVYVPPPVVQPAPRPKVAAPPVYTPPAAVAAAPPTAAPSAASSDVPWWDDLPLEFRSTLLLPHIDVHVFDDDPARRFILVNLQKFREGETLDNGAVVEVINADSIQLYYNGTRFLMDQ